MKTSCALLTLGLFFGAVTTTAATWPAAAHAKGSVSRIPSSVYSAISACDVDIRRDLEKGSVSSISTISDAAGTVKAASARASGKDSRTLDQWLEILTVGHDNIRSASDKSAKQAALQELHEKMGPMISQARNH